MSLALTFAAPLLLLGVLAAGIPVLLHLLSSVRAQEAYFPTLRFLRISMEKTARRRRLEHWLLLVVRSLLLGALAIAVAEPILKGAAGFWSDRRFAAVLVVDNSYSMGVRSGGSSRFQTALGEAKRLLSGEAKPSLAAVMLTNAAAAPTLQADLGEARAALESACLASGRAPIAQRVAQAVRLLEGQTTPQKAVYILSDLQQISFEDLARVQEVRKAGIPLMLVDCSGQPCVNVGIAELKITGQRIVDQPLKFSATLVNSSPTDMSVNVHLEIDGRRAGEAVRTTLRRAGAAGAKATVRFSHRFTRPGAYFGKVAIEEGDDLAVDNVRRFSLDVADRAAAVVVRGAGPLGGAMDPGGMLQIALDPQAGPAIPWPIRIKTVTADELSPAGLAGVQAVFLADLPGFTPEQAAALVDFVARGGSAAFFLGPATAPARYNDLFVAGTALPAEQARAVSAYGGLLPGRIGQAVGQVGTQADALKAVRDRTHPYLADLWESPADYPDVLVQRYYQVSPSPGGCETVLATPPPASWPIVSAKTFGAGRCVLVATTASAEWSNLPTGAGALFVPLTSRICLEAAARLGGDNTYAEGAAVTIRPPARLPAKAAVNVSLPDQSVEVMPLAPSPGGPAAVFTKTREAGVYHWQVVGAPADEPGARGAFVTNPDGVESDLAAMDAGALAKNVAPADLYAGKSIEEVHAAAAKAAAGDNLWDRAIAVVILLLVVEAVIANTLRRGTEPVPAHLNPKIAA